MHAGGSWRPARPVDSATILLVQFLFQLLFQLTGCKPLAKDQTQVALEP